MLVKGYCELERKVGKERNLLGVGIPHAFTFACVIMKLTFFCLSNHGKGINHEPE